LPLARRIASLRGLLRPGKMRLGGPTPRESLKNGRFGRKTHLARPRERPRNFGRGLFREKEPICSRHRHRPGKEKQKPDGDREWLAAFTVENPSSLGYAVLVDFAEGGGLRRLTVSRREGGEWSEQWFARLARET
jgi:hypothetical protein